MFPFKIIRIKTTLEKTPVRTVRFHRFSLELVMFDLNVVLYFSAEW